MKHRLQVRVLRSPIGLILSAAFGSACAVAFQFRAGALLAPSAFAALSHWLFLLGMCSVPAVALQTFGALRGAELARHRGPVVASWVGMLLLLLVCFAWPSPSVFLISVALMSAVAAVCLGMLQARLAYTALMLASSIPLLARWGMAELLFRAGIALPFERAVLVGTVVVVSLLLLGGSFSAPAQTASESAAPAVATWSRVGWGGGALALAGLLFPFLDFEIVKWIGGASWAAAYAKPALFGRMICYGGQMYAQASAPAMLRESQTHNRKPLLVLLALCAAGSCGVLCLVWGMRLWNMSFVEGIQSVPLLVALLSQSAGAIAYFLLQARVLKPTASMSSLAIRNSSAP